MEMSSVSRSTYQRRSKPLALTTIPRVLTDARIHDLEAQGLYSNPLQYYDFLQNRVMIIFRPKFEEPDNDRPEFNLILSKKHNYDIVSSLKNFATRPNEAIDGRQSRRIPST